MGSIPVGGRTDLYCASGAQGILPRLFGSSSSLPPPTGVGGALVCESVGKTDLLSDNFDNSPGILWIS